MKIAFNPSTVAALTTPPNNKDITFDLRGRNIFARGVKFCGTDTNTWRDIKINNVSIDSNILDLRNGSNTTLTNTNGVVTINSTWRPVVDNLTSDSTTSSLSAKQGKILKSLIDGKSNSGHTHDDRYLKLTGGTMASNALITFADSGSWGTDKGPQGARGGLYWTGQSDYAKLYAEETVGDNLDLVIQFGDDNSNGLSIRNKANTQTSYISAGGVITTGTFKGNLDWSYITNKPSSYTPSAHTHAWNSLTHSSTTENQAILTNGKANGWKLYTLNISRWDNAANNAHSHANKSVLDGITSALVNNWNIAYNFVHTITETDTDKVINKWDEIVNFLAGITEDNKLNTLLNNKLSVYKLADNTNVGAIKNNGIYYSTTDASSGTLTNSPFNTGFALINMTSYDGGDDLRRSRLAFNAYGEIKVSNDRDQANTAETWYNVLTSKNSGISGSTIKLNGTSITVYSSSTADGRYVKKSGDTMSGTLTIDTTNFGALTIKRNDDANGASIQFRGKSSVYGYIGLNNSTKDKQFLRWNSDTSKTYTILDTSSTYTSNGKGVINGTTITQVDNATNSTNSTNARKLVNWYSSRPTSLNTQFGDGSLRIFYATSSTTEGKPAEDSHILHLAWDNNGGWDAQLAVHTRSGKVSTRAQNSGTWQPWKTLAFTTDIPSSLKNPYSLNVFGVTYDGSAAKVVSPSNFISQVNEATSTVTDGTMLITSYASNSGFADTNAVNIPYKRKAIHLWEYIKAKTDSLYTTKSHNHDDRYVRAFGTSNDNIDSDWGQSFKTFDPIPSGTPPEQNPNISILNIGNNFNRRKQLAFIYSNDNIYYRRHVDNSFTNWRRIAFANEIPTSLKNPYALTISLNGTSQGPYDGSAAKNINITPGSIGAAVSNHSHDYLVVNAADNKSFNSAYHNFQVLYAGGGNGITGKPTNVDAFGLFKFRVASGWSGQMLLANGGSLYIRSSEDAKITNTLAWKTILDSSNYSGILDSRYYTESEVNSLLDAKLNRQNLSYGTWNPRGYNLAADYYYNGGDLSISESGGKIHISVDGYFWQNEGQYRVLDTSDISSIRGGLTLYQHLSATDTTRYPLVWGGSDHKNTNNSTGSLYKSYDKLSWQTSSQTLYATNIQTENIKHLSIEGGIYWNPYVESTTDGSDSASITLVRQGVAGGTTLVLSQMNDANDTIQFKTNGSARLYHNSYPILTTQNTYVSNNKGYINGTEITQVNNADKVDNRHAISTTPNTGIIYKAAIYTSSSLTSYWVRLASISSISQNAEFIATIHVQSGHSNPGRSAILLVYLRGSASSFISKSFKIYCNSNYDPNRFRLYYKDSDKTSEIWYQTTGQWDGIITTVISQSSEGSLYEGLTLYNVSITAVQTPSMSTYLSAQVSTITDNILGNAATATKLQTPRTIWGQSFDGTANISGTLSGVAHIQFSADNTYNIGSNGAASKYIYTYWLGAKSGQKLELGANNSGYGQGLCIDTNLNVGIGTNTPTYKLHVNGTFRATNSTVSDLFVNTGDATLKIYTGITTDAQNDGNICFQTSIDATDGQSHAHPTQYQSRCNIVLQPRGGQVYIGTNPGTGNTTYKLYVNSKIFSNGGFVKNGSSDSYVLLGGGGHKAVSAFAPSSHSHNYAANENYGGFTKSGRLPISGFYQSNASESGGNAPWSGWMHLINCQHSNTGNNYALQIAASFSDNNTFKIRVTNNNVNNAWRDIIHSGNIGNQTVANAYHLRINSANTWSTWYWSGQGGQPSWLWGSNDGTNMYVWNPSNFRVAYASSAGNADTVDGYHEGSFVHWLGNKKFSEFATTYNGGIYNMDGNPSGVSGLVSDSWNQTVFNVSNYSNTRQKQLVFRYDSDEIYYRRHTDSGWTSTRVIAFLDSKVSDADKLDGIHANGLLTALSNSNNGVSITVGGTTKSISNISVNHANSAGSANTATKLTSSAGNVALPIYFSDGKPVACTASSVFSNLSNSGNNLSITVAGQNRTLTVGYATSAGSTTKVIVNQHTTNDTNYPLVWSNQNNSNNTTENQLYKSWSDLYYNPKNKRLTVGGSVVASSFIKSGGTSQQLLRADGGIATFNWSGQSGQPTWLWGGNNQHSYYVYNPSNFRVAYATSAGSADTLDGVHLSGIFTAFGNNGHNITATIGGTTKSFLVNWAADSDKLDGYHASNLLTSVTNTNNGISVTVGGTTKSVSNISVNYASSSGNADTAQYLRSLGNQNCQTGRTQNYGDVYTYNTYANNTGAPTSYTSVIGFGRGIAGTVEIAGGWDNTNLYWRSLRDCCEDWYSWRTVLDSSNYTEFINNYYWANVKISTSSSTTTSPTVSNLTATSSIRMGNIYLQNTNEINSTSGIHLNYQNSGNISLCVGGGNVGIGAISPAYKLNVNGNIHSSGTINCNALNVGSTLSIKDSVISCSASDISIESKESGSLLINSREVLHYDSDSIYMNNRIDLLHGLCFRTSILDTTYSIYTTDDVTVLIGVLRDNSSFKFRPAKDGQLLFLKIGKLYSDTYFWCTAENCVVVRAKDFGIYLDKNQNKDCFGDGQARIFIYVDESNRWYEFYCG